MKRSILFPLFILAVIFLFGFGGWALSCHGTIGLLRVTPIFFYALIIIAAAGMALIGLFLWYLRLSRGGKGPGGKRLSCFLLTASLLCVASFPCVFARLGGFPPVKEIQPISRLSLPDTDGYNLHFAAGGDTHFGAGTNSPDRTMAMLDQISDPANKYDLFFSLGDLVEYGFVESQWNEASQVFSAAASSVPIYFTPGNHDTLFGGLSRYADYCRPAAIQPQNGPVLWYRVDAGRAHFLVLDVEWSAETYTEAQADWLETQLVSIPAGDWKIIISHGFYYSSGITLLGWHWYDNPETISALAPLFEKYGVDIVFSAHNHYLEFLQHSGVSYVVSGGFGGKLDPTPTYLSPSSIWLRPDQLGFADVNINADKATLNFRDPDSNILKSFTITKH
jgi:hypothetical protein